MRNISFQDLFVKPLGADSTVPRRGATCVYFGSSFSRVPKISALSSTWNVESGPDKHLKGSIGFILSAAATTASTTAVRTATGCATSPQTHSPTRYEVCGPEADDLIAAGFERLRTKRSAPTTASDGEASPVPKRKKREARICKEPGCGKYVVDHGLCIRHGGGKRCNVEGCNCRAQNRGLCWKHGGFTICKVEGCAKRAKSRGICWSHGGGTRCKTEGCTKIAVSLGRCWAHGGGKRCAMDDCRKPASERTNNFCPDHFTCCQRDLFMPQPQFVGK